MKKSVEIAEQLKIEEFYRDMDIYRMMEKQNQIAPPPDKEKHYYVKRVKRDLEKYYKPNKRFTRDIQYSPNIINPYYMNREPGLRFSDYLENRRKKYEWIKNRYNMLSAMDIYNKRTLFSELPFLERKRADSHYYVNQKIRRKRSVLPMNNVNNDHITKFSLSNPYHNYVAAKSRFIRSLLYETPNTVFLSKRSDKILYDNLNDSHNSAKESNEFKPLPKISREDFIKRIKRTSRKTEKLNQTTATIPKRFEKIDSSK